MSDSEPPINTNGRELLTPEPATTATHADVMLVQSGQHELSDAYRHAVGVALHLQRLLALPPADRLVIERRERLDYIRWRAENGG